MPPPALSPPPAPQNVTHTSACVCVLNMRAHFHFVHLYVPSEVPDTHGDSLLTICTPCLLRVRTQQPACRVRPPPPSPSLLTTPVHGSLLTRFTVSVFVCHDLHRAPPAQTQKPPSHLRTVWRPSPSADLRGGVVDIRHTFSRSYAGTRQVCWKHTAAHFFVPSCHSTSPPPLDVPV